MAFFKIGTDKVVKSGNPPKGLRVTMLPRVVGDLGIIPFNLKDFKHRHELLGR